MKLATLILLTLLALAGCHARPGSVVYRLADGATIKVKQPVNPAGSATVAVAPDGGVKVEVPPTYKPADPPTPTMKALGQLVFWSGIVGLVGLVLLASRFFGTGLLAKAPIGWGVGFTLGGFGSAATFHVFATYSGALAVGVAGMAVGLVVSYWDNIRGWLASRRSATLQQEIAG